MRMEAHVDADASELGRALALQRWAPEAKAARRRAELSRSAGVVLERAELSDATRAELEQIAGDPAQDGDGQ